MAKESSISGAECKTAFWLLPAREDARELEMTIETLARRHDGPVFTPHVTILCTRLEEGSRPGNLLGKLAQSFAPLSLEARGADAESSFTKSLFLRFAKDPILEQLRQVLTESAIEPGLHVPFDPHLSLLYAHIPMETKLELAKKITIAQSPFRFDRIQAVQIPGPTRTAADVRQWRRLGEELLGNDPR